MHYIIKRNSTYYFRLRVPSDMRRYLGPGEIVSSLHTRTFTHAKRLAHIILGKLEKIFMVIRAGVLTDDEIAKVVDSYKREQLAKSDAYMDTLLSVHGGDVKAVRNDLLGYHAEKAEIAKDILLDNRGMEEQTVYTASVLAGIPWEDLQDGVNIASYSPEFKRLCNAVALANKEIYEILLQRNSTGDSDYDRLERSKPKSKTLADLIDIYHREKSSNWLDAATTKSIHKRILHILGDIRLDEIDREMCIGFRDALKEYPLKNSDFVTPWRELAKRKKGRLSERTQHSTLSEFITLLKYASKHPYGLRGLPADGLLGAKADCKKVKIRLFFTIAELNQLVLELAKIDRVKAPEQFWVLVLLLYTGARANEICMLRCDDIAEGDKGPVVYFRNRDEYNQRTKNGKDRSIPIHQHLIDLGLLDYLEQQKLAGHDRLFSNLELYNGKWNKNFGKWFNRTFKLRFLGQCSEEELSGKDLHTFRVTFISWFIKSGLVKNLDELQTLIDIVGHCENQEMKVIMKFLEEAKLTVVGYGGGFITDPAALLQQLDYGIDLTPLFNR